MHEKPIYPRRLLLRKLEQGWTAVERTVDRLTRLTIRFQPYNPLYHLGQLGLLLLIILTVTGAYLTIFYRPGADRAYQSVIFLSANWFGQLMRTSHRYAADGIVVVVLLHALKMLLSDRFWGSRWLAWVTGWVLLALTWSLGVMGYWLVWDEPAQWLTEWAVRGIGGPLAYSFFSPNAPSATFALFVIILFLHVFLPPLAGVGIIIHVLRLARARYWTPRWLVWATVAVLTLISLALPVANGIPADFGRVITATELDWLYLGFLPVAEQWGTVLTWGLTLLLVGLLFVLPWLGRGQHEGPAVVIPVACTGCGACVRECPYAAIDLQQRDDDSGYTSLALVKPDLCTGCGICVGSCPDKAIELERLPSPVVRQDLQRRLREIAQTGETAVTIYLCDRHQALGTLPPLQPMPGSNTIPLMQAKLPPRVNVGTWEDENGSLHPIMTATVPCSGMLHPNWASETLQAGGAGAIVITCPAADCANREGPHWIGKRLIRRSTLRQGNTHFLELAPGSQRDVQTLWQQMVRDQTSASADLSTVGLPKEAIALPTWPQRLRHLLPGTILLLLLLLLSLLPTWEVGRSTAADQAGLRLVLNHNGQRMADANNLPPDIAAKLPPNVDPVTILGGQRFPLQLKMTINGATVLERTYEASGLRSEGAVYATETHWLQPGSYHVVITLADDGSSGRTVFDNTLLLEEKQMARLFWQEAKGTFEVQESQ